MRVVSHLTPSSVFNILAKYSKEFPNGVVPEGLWTTIASNEILGSGKSLSMKFYNGELKFRIGFHNMGVKSAPTYIEYKYPEEITIKKIRDTGAELGTYFRL